MRDLIFKQIQDAFDSKPDLDGILHGLRRIKQGKHGSRSSLFFSAKNKAFMPVESRVERAFCYELEANPAVSSYRVQVLKIPFRNNYLFPDFLIFGVDGTPFVREVKASAFVDSEKNIVKTNFLGTTFGNIGIEYGVVTELDYWRSQETKNWAMLYDRGGRLAPSTQLIQVVRELAISLQSTELTVQKMRAEIAAIQLPQYLVEAAIFSGALSCNMIFPITSSTKLEVM